MYLYNFTLLILAILNMLLYFIFYLLYLYVIPVIKPSRFHFSYHIIIWPPLAPLTISLLNYPLYKYVSDSIMFHYNKMYSIIIILTLVIVYLIAIDTAFKITILVIPYIIEIKSNSFTLNVFSPMSIVHVIPIFANLLSLNLKIIKTFCINTCNGHNITPIVRQIQLIFTQYKKRGKKKKIKKNYKINDDY